MPHRPNTPAGAVRRAFTLIELLIVVAILAAIAVPNFLEAQIRAKTSRARSDMRTLATALETYAVDYNKHPPALGAIPGGAGLAQPNHVTNFYGTSRVGPWRTVPPQVTTPIAYISSVIQDVFKIGVGCKTYYGDTDENKAQINGNALDGGFVYQNIKQYVDAPSTAYNNNDITAYGYWRLMSLGPNKTYANPGNGDPTLGWIYDPTNGTISTGFLIRTQRDSQLTNSIAAP